MTKHSFPAIYISLTMMFALVFGAVSAVDSGADPALNAGMVILSPPAFTNLWEQYAEYRRETHPDLGIAIKNTAEIYSAQPEAVAKGDYALAIHKYLEGLYDGGSGRLRIVLLGAGAPGFTTTEYITNYHAFVDSFLPFDPETQIPTRYPTVAANGRFREASDMYYACMDKTDVNAAEVWDYDGDGIYLGVLQSNGTILNEARASVDWEADLEVMRVPLEPLVVETTGNNVLTGDVVCKVTAAEQMTNFVEKIRYLESPSWTGAGRHAILGSVGLSGFEVLFRYRGTSEPDYLHEQEFYDGAINTFSPSNGNPIVANEWTTRYRIWEYATATRASDRVWHCVDMDSCTPGVYGAENEETKTPLTRDESYAKILSEDHETVMTYSHGWPRGVEPISSQGFMRGDWSNSVSRVFFTDLACDSGMFDYCQGNQIVTNHICVGAATILGKGGAAASFNNSRLGEWGKMDAQRSSGLESLLMCAAYNGNCTNMAFDIDNPHVTNPIGMGRALLLARRAAVAAANANYGNFGLDAEALAELNGFGDPLITLSPQGDATDDFTANCVRKLTLTQNPTVAMTNAAAVLDIGAAVDAIRGDGILRATVETDIAGDTLDWSVAGGMGRKIAFANPGGILAFSGEKKRYAGPKFENVGEIIVRGSNVTIDFGLESDNRASCPVDSLSFANSYFGTNTLRNASVFASTNLAPFFANALCVSNSVLRAETCVPFPAAVTNGEIFVAPNPLWKGLEWNAAVELNDGRFTIGQNGFSLTKGATFNIIGDGEFGSGGTISDITSADFIKASGDISANLSNGGWLNFDIPIRSPDADATLTVRGNGILYLPHIPLIGVTNLVVGARTTLVIPGDAAKSILLLAGSASASITFEGDSPRIFCVAEGIKPTADNLTEMENPSFKNGTVVPANAATAFNPPYERTLYAAAESWFNSSAWTGDGSPFSNSWANLTTYAGDVNLRVADGADDIVLTIENTLSMNKLSIFDTGGARNLTIKSSALPFFGTIDASGFSGILSLDFDLGYSTLTANRDTHVLGANGNGALTIPAGCRATLYNGEWPGTVSNSGILKRHSETNYTFTAATILNGTNSFSRASTTANLNSSAAGKVLLVEDGDVVTISNYMHSIGFCVEGGNLVFSQPKGSVWIGDTSTGNCYWQTGGTTTVEVASATAANTGKEYGLLLGYSGYKTWTATVSGGLLTVPNAHINFWQGTIPLTITGEGVVSAKGLIANGYSASKTVNVSNGGTLLLGETGIATTAPVVTIANGGILAAIAETPVNSAITVTDGTLAAVPGRTLLLSVRPAITGTLMIGTTNYTGTVDFGRNRFVNAALSANSHGTIAFTATDAEYAAGFFDAFAFEGDTLPDIKLAVRKEDGTALGSSAAIVHGKVRIVVRDVVPVLPRPSAVWNADFADNSERGGFKFNLNGNSLNNGIVTFSTAASGGVTVMNEDGFDKSDSRFIAVAGLNNLDFFTDAYKGVFFTIRSSIDNNRVGLRNNYMSLNKGIANGTDFDVSFSPSGRGYPDDLGLHYFGAYYSTANVAGYTNLGGKGLFAYVDINRPATAVVAGKEGLVYSSDEYYGFTFGGLYGSNAKPLADAKMQYLAVFTNVQAVATNVISAWSLDAMTMAEKPADGAELSGGANVGVNLSGGRVIVNGTLEAAALFVQSDTTLEFGEGATLTVNGPVYIADGVRLSIDSAVTLSDSETWEAMTINAVAFDDGQIISADDNRLIAGRVGQNVLIRRASMPVKVSVPLTIDGETISPLLSSSWITNYYPEVTTREAAIAAYNATAANGSPVWQNYMLGLDPTDEEAGVSLAMSVVDGKISFSVEGLGETHPINGISVKWSIKTATDLTHPLEFPFNRETAAGLPPEFEEHSVPDRISSDANSETSPTLFYRLSATFTAE